MPEISLSDVFSGLSGDSITAKMKLLFGPLCNQEFRGHNKLLQITEFRGHSGLLQISIVQAIEAALRSLRHIILMVAMESRFGNGLALIHAPERHVSCQVRMSLMVTWRIKDWR